MQQYEKLIKTLINRGVLCSQQIADAFKKADRADFMSEGYKSVAGEDRPFPIPAGQTISQPYTVALMMEWLRPELGQKILDVGAGSGWTTAILGYIVGEQGRVVGTERIEELVDFARRNLADYDLENVSIKHTPDQLGYPEDAPYDRILVSAAASDFPKLLKEQLEGDGIIVAPVASDVVVYDAETDSTQHHHGFSFVPLK